MTQSKEIQEDLFFSIDQETEQQITNLREEYKGLLTREGAIKILIHRQNNLKQNLEEENKENGR